MKRILFPASIVLLLIFSAVCCTRQPKKITAIKGEQITIDSTYDANPDTAVAAIVAKYQSALTDQLQEVIGKSAREMSSRRPESLLSNFTTDAMLEIARNRLGKPVDFSLVNFGGLRAVLPAGDIRLYDTYTIYPFENRLVILTLEGKYVRELFEFFATNRIEPMGNVSLKIKDKKLDLAKIDGQVLDDAKIYTLVTLDFIAQGGDGMTVFSKAASYEPTELLLRDAMIDYIKTLTSEDKIIDAKLDGRANIVP